MAVKKANGFASPYRSQTFQTIQKDVTQFNGVIRMDGVVSQSGPNITLPPFVVIQNGLLIEDTLGRTLTAPSMSPPYYLTVTAISPANVDDLVFQFAKSPEDISDNQVLLAEHDGTEWRQLQAISIKEILGALDESRLDVRGKSPLSGLITSYSAGFLNSAGSLIDSRGSKITMDDSITFPDPGADPEPTWSRIDRIVHRRGADSINRIGRREYLIGPSYSTGAQTLNNTSLESGAFDHGHVKVLIASDNTAHFLWSRGYGNNFLIYYAKYSSDRTTALVAATTLVTSNIDKFDAVLDDSDHIHLVYGFGDNIFWRKFSNVGAPLAAAVAIDNQANPTLNPTLAIDLANTKLFFAFQVLVSPAKHQIYFGTIDLTGAIITATAAKTATLTNLINPHIHVDNDIRVYIAYEEQPSGKIFYQLFDSFGILIPGLTPTPVQVSGATGTTSFGTLVDGASFPKIAAADNESLYITFLQNKGGANLLAVWQDGSAFGNDITSPAENFTAYDFFLDPYMNQVYLTLVQAGQVDLGYIEDQEVILTESISGSGGNSAALVRDNLGSLLHIWSSVSPGTYTNVGGPETVSYIGPTTVVGSMNNLVLTSSQMALATPLAYVPLVGDKFTIAGSVAGNNGSKFVTAVSLQSINTPNDYYVVTASAAFASVESPAVAVTSQFATPDGNALRFIKTIGDTISRAYRMDVLPTDVLLARIMFPGPIILNYIPFGSIVSRDILGMSGSPVVDWEETLAGNLTIAGGLKITDLIHNFVYNLADGSFPMGEDDALYVFLEEGNFSPTPQVAQINLLPWSAPIQVLGFIKGGVFNPHLLTMGGIDELVSGESGTVGQDLPQVLRDRLGLINDKTFEDYTSFVNILVSDNYPEAISKLDAALSTIQNSAAQEEYFTVGVGGQSIFNAGSITWTADSSIPDIQVTVNGDKVKQSPTGTFVDGDFKKNSSTQIEFGYTVPQNAEITIRQERTGGNGIAGEVVTATEDRFTVGVGGQSIFNSALTWVPTVSVLDIKVVVNGDKVQQSLTGLSGDGDYKKNSSNQIQFFYTVPQDAEVIIIQERSGSVDLGNITTDPSPDTNGARALGKVAKGWKALYLKDTTSAQVYRLDIVSGVLNITPVP